MTRPEDLGRTPLAARRREDPAPDPQRAAPVPRSTEPPSGAPDNPGRPCWIEVGGEDRPVWLHAWRRTVDDPRQWEGLVLGWLPAEVVRPRRTDT